MFRIIGSDGKEYGPVSAEQLRQWIIQGRANAASQVLAEGGTEWKPLGSYPEFSLWVSGPGQQGQPAAVVVTSPIVKRTSSFAITGLVFGLISLTIGLCCCYGMPFNILGIIFSIIGLSEIKKNPETYEGRGMAITGIVLSIISLVLSLLMMIIFGFAAMVDGFRNLE